MQKRFFLSLAALLVLGLLVQDAEARGGRRGGGRFGNGDRAGNRPNHAGANNIGANGARDGRFGANNFGANNLEGTRQGQNFRSNTQNGADNRQFGQRLGNLAGQLQGAVNSGALNNLFKDVDAFGKDFAGTRPGELRTNFTAQNRPFTGDWYAAHPNAWRYSHPHADAWAVASIGAVGSWLGIAALNDGTVYTSETQDDADDSDDGADKNTDETPAAGDFLPLGVFGIAAPGSQDASALIQLATDRQGELRGNYYDVLSGQEQPLTGTINKQTQLATFTVAGNTGTTFEASLVSLTQDTGTLTLRLASGETRQVNLARLKDPTTQPAE